jgi:hypothetical protein
MHAIRLRGPWECQPRKPEADCLGEMLLRRRFNRPTGLENATRVWLVIEEVAAAARVMLNEQPLGEIVPSSYAQALASPSSPRRCPARLEITSLLRPHNSLEIIVDSPASVPIPPAIDDGPGGLLGPVRLEIGADD